MRFTRHITAILLGIVLAPNSMNGQDGLIKKAEQLHNEYKFQEAADLYKKAAESVSDSTELFKIEQAAMMSENGINFLRYTSMPQTRARKNVPLKEIPLWLPVQGGGWASVPNCIVSNSSHYQNTTFFPEGDRILYSAEGIDGSFDIFEITREEGTQWSAPAPIAEINTPGNEIYPFLSADGRTIWFASDGHPGIGGYDLFVSRWDDGTKTWGTPENLGFPYSSTADDILYFDTPDGNWSVLASTRYADAGTATIYVMAFDSNPIKTSITDLSKIQAAAHLEITGAASSSPEKAKTQTNGEEQTAEYTSAVQNMREIQKAYQAILSILDTRRTEYDRASTSEQQNSLSRDISNLEIKAATTKSQLDAAQAAVQNAEMALLKKGIIPPAIEAEEIDNSMPDPEQNFNFARKEIVPAPSIITRIPEPVFNYTFRIQEETEIAPEEIPAEGLVYQIQMIVLSSEPSAARFKGISPVFIRRASGKYVCSVGAFRNYAEASKAVAKVKSKGFSQAFVTAYKDGKSIKVQTARLQENGTPNQSFNVIISGYTDGLPSVIKTTITTNCTKDLAKSTVDGKIIYIIGPFNSQSEAESLSTALNAAGADDVFIETVSK